MGFGGKWKAPNKPVEERCVDGKSWVKLRKTRRVEWCVFHDFSTFLGFNTAVLLGPKRSVLSPQACKGLEWVRCEVLSWLRGGVKG